LIFGIEVKGRSIEAIDAQLAGKAEPTATGKAS